MPVVVRSLHQLVGFLIFLLCLVIPSLPFIHRTVVGMAERDAEHVVHLLVQLHRLAEVRPRRVVHVLMAEDGAYVGVVDGLPQFALQLLLAGERHAQRTVGALVVAHGEVDVAQSVERHHATLLRHVRGVAARLADGPRAVMVVLRHVEHAQSAVVGAQVVERLHHLQRVVQVFGERQLFAMVVQRLVKEALVAHLPAYLSAHDDASQHIAFLLHTLLQHTESVDSV